MELLWLKAIILSFTHALESELRRILSRVAVLITVIFIFLEEHEPINT